MAIDVEPLWAALAARLQANTSSFRAVLRRRKPFSPEELPALIVTDDSGDETLISDPRDPEPQWRLSGEIIVAATTQPRDADSKPTAALNDLVKEVRGALERKLTDPVGRGRGFYTDLGGLVSVLSIVKVEKGVLENQSIAKVTVEMETNPA